MAARDVRKDGKRKGISMGAKDVRKDSTGPGTRVGAAGTFTLHQGKTTDTALFRSYLQTRLDSNEHGGGGSDTSTTYGSGSRDDGGYGSAHGRALGHCEQAASYDITDTGLQPGRYRA